MAVWVNIWRVLVSLFSCAMFSTLFETKTFFHMRGTKGLIIFLSMQIMCHSVTILEEPRVHAVAVRVACRKGTPLVFQHLVGSWACRWKLVVE